MQRGVKPSQIKRCQGLLTFGLALPIHWTVSVALVAGTGEATVFVDTQLIAHIALQALVDL